uniref:sodium-coupled monocarboxylate transporter 2-like n=1 Tax=Ciona intestinalis TaxID=7719 RepID=UPI00006A571E|nr:sodium-coupled monocarboxylate transporter 2-like [Ciona intestinalis]|eukprot:XP_002130613.2 sodium-coupled monocarboxylate transporter 2-like [Ciona intestinalis]
MAVITMRTFSIGDYVVFATMLAVSTIIGLYFAIRDRRKKNTEEYLLAGRSMSPFPVAFSLSVSFMSAVTVLGTPVEVYRFGTMYAWLMIGMLIALTVTAEVFIPVFYNMGLTTVYEYLEKRFNRAVRLTATFLFMVQTILYGGIVIYAPSLALSSVTGFNLWLSVVSTGAVCILYSCLGGLKGVIWTDALQAVVMLVGFISILIQGSIKLGGFANAWNLSKMGGRIEFANFDPDPRVRHSVWSLTVGGSVFVAGLYAVNQSQVQRYLSCRSAKDAKIAALLNWFGLVFLNSLAIMTGIVLYAYYKDCDPLTTGQVKMRDALLPVMVLEIFKDNPGMPGVFLSSIFSGSLSTVSTAITALASVTVHDFLKPIFPWTEKTYAYISMGLVIFYGLLLILFAYLASKLGAILQAAISILGLLGGPLVGLFSIGILFPFVNSIGALCGVVVGIAMNVWVFVGSKSYPPPAKFANALPLSCAVSSNLVANSSQAMTTTAFGQLINTTTLSPVLATTRPPVADLYAMSYMYYSAFGFCFVILVGVIVSLATGGYKTRKEVDPKLIYRFFDHWLFKWVPEKVRRMLWCGVDHDILKQQNADQIFHVEGEVNPRFQDDKL